MAESLASSPDRPLDIDRLKQRDEQEFRLLVERHQRLVMGLAQSMGLRDHWLDDAAAEVFGQVFRALPSFQGRSALSTWIYQIATRTLYKVRAKAKKSRQHQALAVDPIDRRADANPSALLQKNERDERLWAAVATLDPRQAMAIDLYYRQGMGVEEIAGIMSCPENTVKTHLHRARQRLRDMLGAEEKRI